MLELEAFIFIGGNNCHHHHYCCLQLYVMKAIRLDMPVGIVKRRAGKCRKSSEEVEMRSTEVEWMQQKVDYKIKTTL